MLDGLHHVWCESKYLCIMQTLNLTWLQEVFDCTASMEQETEDSPLVRSQVYNSAQTNVRYLKIFEYLFQRKQNISKQCSFSILHKSQDRVIMIPCTHTREHLN